MIVFESSSIVICIQYHFQVMEYYAFRSTTQDLAQHFSDHLLHLLSAVRMIVEMPIKHHLANASNVLIIPVSLIFAGSFLILLILELVVVINFFTTVVTYIPGPIYSLLDLVKSNVTILLQGIRLHKPLV